MCHIRTGRFFAAIPAILSITCAPAAQARAAGMTPVFPPLPATMPAEIRRGMTALRFRAGL